MKILLATHSSRPFIEARCAINSLKTRFSGDRFANMPQFESLQGVDDAVPYAGSLTMWRIDGGHRLTFLKRYDPQHKPQFATVHNGSVIVNGADRLDILDGSLNLVRTITDPWLAGGHTVFMDEDGLAWVNSAPANAVLRIDIEKGKVVERLKMPERYGKGYDIAPDMDVRKRYIPTDLQPTHVNSAFPWKGGVYVTLWIPGVVGYFDEKRRYTEIVRGFSGCHGGRVTKDGGELYLTDSPAGAVWFFDLETGAIKERLEIQSRWLHDAAEADGDVFIGGLGDRNEIQAVSRKNGETLARVECDKFGQSVMFVNICEAPGVWADEAAAPQVPGAELEESGREAVEEFINGAPTLNYWEEAAGLARLSGLAFKSEKKLTREFMVMGPAMDLPAGKYFIEAKIACGRGNLVFGLVDLRSNEWDVYLSFYHGVDYGKHSFQIKEPSTKRLVFAANNNSGESEVEFQIREMTFAALETGSADKLAAVKREIFRESAHQAHKQRYEGELKALQGEIDTRDGMLRRYQAQLDEAVATRDGMIDGLRARLEKETAALEAMASELRAEIAVRDETVAKYLSRIDEIQAAAVELQNNVNLRDEMLAEAQNGINLRDGMLAEAHERSVELQNGINLRDGMLAKAHERSVELQNGINLRDGMLKDYDAKLTETRGELEKALAESQAKSALLDQRLVKLSVVVNAFLRRMYQRLKSLSGK